MKAPLIFFLAILTIHITNAQKWDSVGNGITGGSSSPSVLALATYNGELYAGGRFDSAGGKPASNIARWDGTKWLSVGTGANSWVYALTVYNGKLYAAGVFDSTDGVLTCGIACWDGTKWDSAATRNTLIAYPSALMVYNGSLYVGGNTNVAVLNGTNWNVLGNGFNDFVNSLGGYNSTVFAGGIFDETSVSSIVVNYISQWNGSNWTQVGSGMNEPDGYVYSFLTWNGKLYVGGEFTTAGGVNSYGIASWDGSNWDSVGTSIYPYVYAMTAFKGNLIAAGASGFNEIEQWNGTKWDSLGAGITSGFDVNALAVYNGEVYAGGTFTGAGNIAVNNIARWCDTCASVNSTAYINENTNSFSFYPNPASTEINIALHQSIDGTVTLTNVLGQDLFSKTLSGNNGEVKQLNISGLPQGVYMLKIESNGQAVTKKVLKI